MRFWVIVDADVTHKFLRRGKIITRSLPTQGGSGTSAAAATAPAITSTKESASAFRPAMPIGQYKISREGRQYGPYTAEDIRKYLSSGDLVPSDFVWNEDSARWAPINDLIGERPATPPPPPRSNPPATDSTSFASFEANAKEESRRGNRTDKVALFALEVMGATWFLAPFITVGRQSSTILELNSDGLVRFIGIATISLPFLAVKSRVFFGALRLSPANGIRRPYDVPNCCLC